MSRYLFFQFLLLILCYSTWGITIASWNIRTPAAEDLKAGDGWEQRLPYIARIAIYNDFEILGAQEVVKVQLDLLQKKMPNFSYVGVARDDGKNKGEYAPIFYNHNLFRLEDSGHFWLSKTPNKPSKGWDASYIRICTWAKFTVFNKAKPFFVFNTHLDHQGRTSQAESAKLILSQIQKIAKDNPVILLGDFNIHERDPIFRSFLEGNLLIDSYNTAQIRNANSGTFNHFKMENQSMDRLDHILVSPILKIKKYGILTDTYSVEGKRRFISDHFPVVIEIDFFE